jgi:hypothetical protein
MERNNYIKTDDNKIIKEKSIKWIKKMDECLLVCTKSTGCGANKVDTHSICKLNNPTIYYLLNQFFK